MKASRYNVWIDREDASYVYSGMTGGVLRVSHEKREVIERALDTGGADLAGCSPTTLTRLAEARMIIPDDADELETLALRYRRSRADASRLALTIVTSLGCNFGCPYCFEDKHPSIMSEESSATSSRSWRIKSRPSRRCRSVGSAASRWWASARFSVSRMRSSTAVTGPE